MKKEMPEPTLRIHRYLAKSRSNGPGVRTVVWLQGCTLGCPGCFNPETHSTELGELVPVENLVQTVLSKQEQIEGITISGGEPLLQKIALIKLVKRIREESNLSVVVFTGFEWEEVQRMPAIDELLAGIDVLIAGRYQAGKRLAQGLRGSENKTLHFLSDRYSIQDLEDTPEAEVIIQPDGTLLMSGIDPVRWSQSG